MGKTTAYLRHFFELDRAETYRVENYADYTGPGFARYKASPYFKQTRRGNPGYLKAEVAAYSEMTKIALLIGIVLIVSAVVWGDIKIVQLFSYKEFRTPQAFLWVAPVGLLFNAMGVGMYPRAVFIIKNFKAPIR